MTAGLEVKKCCDDPALNRSVASYSDQYKVKTMTIYMRSHLHNCSVYDSFSARTIILSFQYDGFIFKTWQWGGLTECHCNDWGGWLVPPRPGAQPRP